jgi:hypothetical protein
MPVATAHSSNLNFGRFFRLTVASRRPEEKPPPSLHELRTLSARRYTEQGINA